MAKGADRCRSSSDYQVVVTWHISRVPSCSGRPLRARRSSATQAASWRAVDEVRGQRGAKWDLTLDRQARDLRPRWHMGVKEARKRSRGCGWGGLGSQAVHSASHETPSCHNRHLPALTLNTHQGKGGVASFLCETGGWKRGRMEGKESVISSSCCCDVWGMLGSAPPPPARPCPPLLLKLGCKPANYSR